MTHRFPCTTPVQPADGNSRVPAGACVTLKVSGVSAGTLGSVAETSKATSVVVAGTEVAAGGVTTGGNAAFTWTVEVAVFGLPAQLLDAVSDTFTSSGTPVTGAV